jgi:hypothetical protein
MQIHSAPIIISPRDKIIPLSRGVLPANFGSASFQTETCPGGSRAALLIASWAGSAILLRCCPSLTIWNDRGHAGVVSPHIHKIKQIVECLEETSMRTLLISTTAAILLLGAGAVSAQGIKTDETPGAPAAQQNAPAEKMAPAVKSDQSKAPEKTGQATPIMPDSANKQQTTDKGAPAGATAKGSSEANGSAVAKSKRAERHGGARYASRHHGPLYNSYRGDHGYRDCHRHHRHSWMPWLGC